MILVYHNYNECNILKLDFIQERQQFHLEQLKAAEFRARSAAQQQLNKEAGVTVGPVTGGQPGAAQPPAAAAAVAVGQAPPAPSAAPAPQ